MPDFTRDGITFHLVNISQDGQITGTSGQRGSRKHRDD